MNLQFVENMEQEGYSIYTDGKHYWIKPEDEELIYHPYASLDEARKREDAPIEASRDFRRILED